MSSLQRGDRTLDIISDILESNAEVLRGNRANVRASYRIAPVTARSFVVFRLNQGDPRLALDQAGGERAGFFHGAPDLAVEIESAERARAMQARIQDYLDAGTTLLWVIHAETHSATVYHTDGSARLMRDSDVLDGEQVLPGLQIPLRELFQD